MKKGDKVVIRNKFCNSTCKYLERDKKHTCTKYNQRLTWIRYNGPIDYGIHEQCKKCIEAELEE